MIDSLEKITTRSVQKSSFWKRAAVIGAFALTALIGGCGSEGSSGNRCKSDYDCPGVETICEQEKCVYPNGDLFCYDDLDCPGEKICDNNKCSGGESGNNQAVLSPNTKILTAVGAERLYNVSPNSLSFQGDSAYAQDLHTGDIVVTGVSTITPQGLLREVVSVQNNGAEIQVQTKSATLEQALTEGSFQFSVNLSDGLETVNAPLRSGKSDNFETKRAPLSVYSINVNFDNTDLYQGMLFLDGNLQADIDSHLSVDISWNQVERVRYTITGQESLDLVLRGEIDQELHQELPPLEPVQFAPVTFFLPTVPPFPIVLTPNLSITLGVDAAGQISAQTSASQSLDLEVGLEYKNGTWQEIAGIQKSFGFDPPSLGETTGGVEVYVKPRFELQIYDIVGPSAEVRGHLRGEARIQDGFWYKLFAGLRVDIGVKVDAFGKTLVDYAKTVFEFEKLLASSEPIEPVECWNNQCDYEGQKTCNPGKDVVACRYNPDTKCLEWVIEEQCWAKDMNCVDGHCEGSDCNDKCDYTGQTKCASDTKQRTCGDYDSDPCLEWSDSTTCSNGGQCIDNACQTSECLYANHPCATYAYGEGTHYCEENAVAICPTDFEACSQFIAYVVDENCSNGKICVDNHDGTAECQ
ncbi:hypothetical protein COY27_03000 [Candidatus Woesearchaeota archaeon CG_4_10_14_0_2_um_filter_33_13]|nr:MAG: hypothetical protein COY27_03000 [Candidatus Woesearchaeota archaeon CG_4_10_14_0_2_um_filter_33_13]